MGSPHSEFHSATVRPAGTAVDSGRASICIATHKRADRLAALLADIAAQTRLPEQIVIVDNDPAASARATVEDFAARHPQLRLSYEVQPVKNISITRNRTVALADGDWLAFVDDDERAPPQWLQQLLDCALAAKADGVLGPVLPVLPEHAPRWIARGHFYDWPRQATGTEVERRNLRFGNLILHRRLCDTASGPFDPAYGLTGGEDGDLLIRLTRQGARVLWCDEAVVTEPVETSRLRFRWLALRALRGGQDFARHRAATTLGRFNALDRVVLIIDAAFKLLTALVLALVCLPAGRHRSAWWLFRACGNAGKISLFLGMHYREYGPRPT
jgi:succinoglycan biosynthesis protein ExoM